ncbi:hypothetical protein D9611_008227 [Ephemerocybe angulata]|uniref:Uncharacterized protein n=1 Tax=Ephemerocybe angulata TaxID=980116 RepID=A0A8H5BIM9_9AGAR|nr:hypothetical protein D9611_008227 [Tulosesus angulatus]
MGTVDLQEAKGSNDLLRPTPTPTFPPTSSTLALAPQSSLAFSLPNPYPRTSWAPSPPERRSDYDSTSASSPSSNPPARSTAAASVGANAEKISTTAVLAGVLGSFGFFVLLGVLFIFWRKRKMAAERAERRRNRARRKEKGGSGGQDGVQGPGRRTKEVKEIAEMARMHEEPTNLRPPTPAYTTPNASSQTKQKSQAIQQDRREQHGTRQGETSLLTRPTPAQQERNGSDFNQPSGEGTSGTRVLGVPSSSPALQAIPGEPKITSGKRILAVANDTTPTPNGRPQPQGMTLTREDAHTYPSGSPRRNALPRLRESQEEERPGTPVPLHPPLREFSSHGSGRGSPASGRLRQPRRRLASAAGDATASDSEYFSDASIGTRQTLMSTISASRAARNNSARGVPVQQQVVLDLPPAYTPD